MRTQGCGHGECTTAETPCRYETPGCAPKLPDRTPEEAAYPRTPEDFYRATAGAEVRPSRPVSLFEQMGGTLTGPTRSVSAIVADAEARWHPSDLDRCEHGRHSIDYCFDCPGGNKGNPFLLDAVPHEADHRPRHVRTVDGRVEVRIGTMVRGEPIWVVVRDMPRVNVNKEAEPMTEQEADGKLPCSECGHRVRPGRHTQAECIRNQQDDAAEGGASIDGRIDSE